MFTSFEQATNTLFGKQIVLSDEKLSQRTLFSDLEEYLVKADGNLKIQNILANYFSSSPLRNSHLEKLKNIVRDSNSSLEEKLKSTLRPRMR